MQIYSPAGIIHFGSAHEDAFDVLSRFIVFRSLLSCPNLADEPRLLAMPMLDVFVKLVLPYGGKSLIYF
jgi:hypothetical protein